MSKIALFLLMLPVAAMSQISDPVKDAPRTVVGKLSVVGTFIAELSYVVDTEAKDTIYTLMYNDARYQRITEIKSINFSGVDNTVGKLYEIFSSVYSDANKNNKDYSVTFKLGRETVSVSRNKGMGGGVMFLAADKGYFVITKGQVDKLFGK